MFSNDERITDETLTSLRADIAHLTAERDAATEAALGGQALVDELRAERDDWQRAAQAQYQGHEDMQERWAGAVLANGELQAALQAFGRHTQATIGAPGTTGCYRLQWGLLKTKEEECDCGLYAAQSQYQGHEDMQERWAGAVLANVELLEALNSLATEAQHLMNRPDESDPLACWCGTTEYNGVGLIHTPTCLSMLSSWSVARKLIATTPAEHVKQIVERHNAELTVLHRLLQSSRDELADVASKVPGIVGERAGARSLELTRALSNLPGARGDRRWSQVEHGTGGETNG